MPERENVTTISVTPNIKGRLVFMGESFPQNFKSWDEFFLFLLDRLGEALDKQLEAQAKIQGIDRHNVNIEQPLDLDFSNMDFSAKIQEEEGKKSDNQTQLKPVPA